MTVHPALYTPFDKAADVAVLQSSMAWLAVFVKLHFSTSCG